MDDLILNGRYQLLERIGSGGMSVVYKARDRSLGRIVAIKMLHENLTSDEGFLRRFQQEAHAAANLTHPNIVTVHDIGQDNHRHYIVMEYVAGKTLKQIIRSELENGRTMPLNRALDLAIEICGGIGYAHRAGLVHCDVKPQNVIVTPDERVKVADFGIARAISSATQQQIVSQVWGTPQYFAPEQAAGQPPTPATDVYAIGVVLFEMLTGRIPFEAESHMAMALKHLHEIPANVSTLNPAVPQQLAQIVAKLLAKEPAARYRTAGQVGRILSAYRHSSQADTGMMPAVTAEQPDERAVPVAEQMTQIYQRPSLTERQTTDVAEKATAVYQRPPHPNVADETAVAASQPQPDWTIISLGIAAVVALLGLIPMWILAYLAWTG